MAPKGIISPPTERSQAYGTLDGLRGVAALVVVTRHIGSLLPVDPFPESFLAVDLFFLLSGFVVAHAYEARLLAREEEAGALSMGGFMRLRLIRLYPLYGLGIALGLLATATRGHGAGAAPSAAYLIQATVIGLLMLPGVPPLPMRSSTLDGPTWTLFPELVVNLVYAAAVRRLGRRALMIVVAIGALGLMASEAVYGSLDEGWSFTAFPLIAARLAFSFFLGVLLFRLRLPRRAGPAATLGCLAVLAASLAITPPEHLRALYELAAVLIVFPIIVTVAVQREPGSVLARPCRLLGLVSYAVYVLHEPLGELAGRAVHAAGWKLEGAPAAAAFMAALVLLCAMIDRIYDAPVRRWLQRRVGRRQASTKFEPAALGR